MNRRHAIARISAATAALARAADSRAQGTGKLWRIGFLHTARKPPSGAFSASDALLENLRVRGFERDRHVAVQALYAEERLDDLPALTARLLDWKPDLIVTLLSPAAHAAKRATATVPIVMLGAGDPVGSGLVQSLARPGGNVTGVAAQGPELAGKTLELLRELRPTLRRVAVLAHGTDPFTPALLQGLRSSADALSLQLDTVRVTDVDQYAAAFDAWRQRGADGLFVQPSLRMKPAIELAQQRRLPSCSFVRGFVEQGGLLAYASSLKEVARLGAAAVEQILRGARPADLPVQQVGVFDLLLNRGAARALGLALPKAMLQRADEVIE